VKKSRNHERRKKDTSGERKRSQGGGKNLDLQKIKNNLTVRESGAGQECVKERTKRGHLKKKLGRKSRHNGGTVESLGKRGVAMRPPIRELRTNHLEKADKYVSA